MSWGWLPQYLPEFLQGLGITLFVLVASVVLGFALAIVLGIAQVTGGVIARNLARGFCWYIRGTPLLIQLYFLYYGLGSLFPMIPAVQLHMQWLLRLDAIYYVLLAFTMNFAGYEGEIMRGAFLSVPRGEIEVAQALGMNSWQVLRRIWLPSALGRIWPTLAGEVISQLKATPLIFTVPVMDLMGVAHQVMQDTYLIYEPLLAVAVIYLALAWMITSAFGLLEGRQPKRRVA